MVAWAEAGQPVSTVDLLTTDHLDPRDPLTVVDVRQEREYAGGHLPGAHNVELGALAAAALPPGPVVTMCGHGERAATAASVLERAGRRDVAIALGGPDDWARPSGRALAVGT
jgi:hydroxyacylglutathione hydrolase